MKWIARLALPGFLAAALLAGREYAAGVAGPRPGPDELSRRAGRQLRDRILESQDAAAWRDRVPVHFEVTVTGGRASGRRFRWTLDPVSRSADIETAGGLGGRVHFDAAAGTVASAPGTWLEPRARRALDIIIPSIGFWTLIPAALDDSTADVWRLPDGEAPGGAPVARLAVRWPGARDWFVFDVDEPAARLRGVTFVDARFTPLVRWYGRYDGPEVIDGRPLPRAWRFGVAPGVLRVLSGGRDLIVILWRSAA